MGINNHWRNKQLNRAMLWQETRCLEFCKQHSNIVWKWHGMSGHFFDVCRSVLNFGTNNNGAIIINSPGRVDVDDFVRQIKTFLHDDVQVAYMAINRYDFRVENYNVDWPDSMEECLDLIASRCHLKFRRLYTPTMVDGKHFVGVHGLDVFVYENN
jgi:hypothetical protein